MKYNTIKNHPDFIEVLENMSVAAKAYDQNMKIAAGLISAGSVLVTAGITMIGIQKQLLRRAK